MHIWFLHELARMVAVEEELVAAGLAQVDAGAVAPREAARPRRLVAREAARRARGRGARRAHRRRRAARLQGGRLVRRRGRGRTSYRYSTYEDEHEPVEDDRPSVLILGSGPEPHRPGTRVRLLLRARRDDVPRAGLRGDHGELQPGDGLDRLRHVRPAVLRAAHDRGRARDRRGREAGRRRDPVRRPDAAAAGEAPHRRRRPDPRHAVPRHRPGRGPPAVRLAARLDRPAGAGLGDRGQRRRGGRGGREDRLPGARAAELRARWPRDAHLLRRGDAALGADRLEHAGRLVRRGRDRDRRRRGLRRRRRADRRRHGARRGGRHPLRRLGLRDPGARHRRRRRGGGAAPDPRAGPGARRRRAGATCSSPSATARCS